MYTQNYKILHPDATFHNSTKASGYKNAPEYITKAISLNKSRYYMSIIAAQLTFYRDMYAATKQTNKNKQTYTLHQM